ncbi:histidinol dehydrogenase [Caldanaerobius polysaccharolyticus]|uniref:histidinol dehydrogenase n=1 Tax=Caldanaerobius polysaccharolyticus TaxID=44256 RepID=UPI00068D31B3
MRILDFTRGIDLNGLAEFTQRTVKDTGEVRQTVDRIINDVRERGDEALLEYTAKLDGVQLTPDTLKVTQEEIDAAYSAIDSELIRSMRKAIKNITAYHEKQKQNSWMDFKDGVIYGQRVRPLDKVGIYVPGGSAAYPSSVLMNAIPALVAGVKEIVMTTPPGKKLNSAVLVAAREVGVSAIYRVGGAQAVAALAFGTSTIPRVDKIVGPGNIYVAMAKRAVYGYVDIDMVAGPSEVLVVADETANPRWVAADMLSQAEHDAMASSVLVTPCRELADKVVDELKVQQNKLERRALIARSLEDYGAIILVKDVDDALYIANEVAPEHLELAVKNPFEVLPLVRNAGAVFLGHSAPEPLGDYIAGPNHVLPTSGTARFFSPLSVDDFVKKMSVLYYSRERLEEVKDDIVRMAQVEGLTAHANAVKVRFDEEA